VTAYVDQCTRVYTRTGFSAHLLRPHYSPDGPIDEALCGLLPDADGWRGTGTQDEHERAGSLPVCRHCAKAAATEAACMPVLARIGWAGHE
jgi:hypothetical protein